MNKKERKILDDLQVTTCWWNMGKKSKDFEGTATEYLNDRNIKIKKKTDKVYPDTFVYSYTYYLGGKTIKVNHRGNDLILIDIVFDIISTLLVHMGDKATLEIKRGEYGNRYFTNNFHR